jgi:hypothetical protein
MHSIKLAYVIADACRGASTFSLLPLISLLSVTSLEIILTATGPFLEVLLFVGGYSCKSGPKCKTISFGSTQKEENKFTLFFLVNFFKKVLSCFPTKDKEYHHESVKNAINKIKGKITCKSSPTLRWWMRVI